MKLKSIIACGLLLLTVGAATTSCEDMFTAENKLVTTDLAPQDTLYQVMGIIKRMQKLADKTVLLGEIRADLVDVNDMVASTDMQDLHSNTVSTNNFYNAPADYYAVINNCNIYLAHVDSLLKSHNQYYYEKEICGVKCFRAWCYLELVKIYGEVPFVTKPIVTADAAEQIVASGKKDDMRTILDFCINDLQKYPYMDKNNELRSGYGQTWSGISYANMFIPVRVMLAELYLWRGTLSQSQGNEEGAQNDYREAIRMYHDYFCFKDEERSVVGNNIDGGYAAWLDRSHNAFLNAYSGYRFTLRDGLTAEQVGVLPCDTSSYYGNTNDLRKVFCSQYSNNYYPWAVPSKRIRDISTSQVYCYYQYLTGTGGVSFLLSQDPNDYDSPELVGDLRLPTVCNTSSNTYRSKENANLNSEQSYIRKYTNGTSTLTNDAKHPFVPYYRIAILYLHMAEALNRGGFPETAFAVLKYGLTYDVMTNRSIISQDEFNRLCEIKSYGFSNIEPKFMGDDELGEKANSSFVIWRSDKFSGPAGETSRNGGNYTAKTPNTKLQIGIHALGSGAVDFNEEYYLDDEATLANIKENVPVPDDPGELKEDASDEEKEAWEEAKRLYDAAVAENAAIDEENLAYLASPEVRQKRQAHVAQLILDEEALEGAFEGYRFYDLMRYQMQEGQFRSTITLPSYITEKYGAAESDNMTGRPWFLTLPSR